MKLSKPELVRLRIVDICSYHHYCCNIWIARIHDPNTAYGMGVEYRSTIANHRDKTYQRIDDIMFGHPFGISLA